MRLADDGRARVPFALVGVLLLVGSASLSASLATRGPLREDRSVGTAMDRIESSASTALRRAVRDAARAAAREPVTAPAETPAGRAINESSPFRDALRIRIYLKAASYLRRTTYRRGEVVAAASLPPVESATDLRAAKRRVRVEGLADGTAVRATVRGVTYTVRRDGRVVARESASVTLTVPTPVLAMHDRTERFQRRLDRGPLAGPGLGRKTAVLTYLLAWERGWAQHLGVPIANVVANRHVALSTNDALLGVQRTVYGRSDPDAVRALRLATLRVGVKDLLAFAPPATQPFANYVLRETGGPVPERRPPVRAAPMDAPSPDRTVSVDVGRSADVAFVELLGGRGDGTLRSVVRGAYRVEAKRRTETEYISDGDRPAPVAPGPNWTLVDERTSERVVVASAESRANSDGGREDGGVGTFAEYAREVTVFNRAERVWRRGNETRRRRVEWVDRYRVSIAVVGEYAPAGPSPDRPVDPLYERGGALDGPNLADVPERAVRRLVEAEGGPDAIARRAVEGGDVDETVSLYGDRPADIGRWIYRDLARLRERVRDVSVDVRLGAAASGESNPPARLAAAIRERRATLLDAPVTYHGVAERARVAARAAYLARVLARLEAREKRLRLANAGYERVLSNAGVDAAGRTARMIAAETKRETRPGRFEFGGGAPGGEVTLVPDGDPAYLTLSAVGHEHVRSLPEGARYHPLVARNVNLFTVPYADPAEGILDAIFDRGGGVTLRTGAHALVAANRTLAEVDNRTLRERRDTLREEIARSLEVVRVRAYRVLESEGSLSRGERRAAVSAAFDRWEGTGRRALAAANGSLAAAIADEANAVGALEPRRTDRLEVRLRVELGRAIRSDAARVDARATNRTARSARRIARDALAQFVVEAGTNATERASRRWFNESLGSVPAGLPVAPVPGYWYATVNVWRVTVRGSYVRFTVRARRGVPDGTGATVRYVRDGSAVALDVDGDGDEERLGWSERISFEVTYPIVVGVPPNGNGVGDIDGDRDERSPGWPYPGCHPPARAGACRE